MSPAQGPEPLVATKIGSVSCARSRAHMPALKPPFKLKPALTSAGFPFHCLGKGGQSLFSVFDSFDLHLPLRTGASIQINLFIPFLFDQLVPRCIQRPDE